MAGLSDLVELFGPPPARTALPEDWAEVEEYVGSALPGDFKAFLDAYGPGVICGELVVFHPRGAGALLTRMRQIHARFGASWRSAPDAYPFRFHPAPGGLVSWGYDHSGDEHFFWPCAPEPDHWKVVTNVNGADPEIFDGTFTDFVLSFTTRLRDADPRDGLDPDALEFLEPEDLDELAALGESAPVTPSFEPSP
ncbi:hypothetical protein [Streptomyces humi]|uniref:hypothetical protein n=1 Tax=Streptomyces humi TaxID=1428620 RepID=UPI0006286FE7|nr:hypothetical protein [Streptomyces humi]